MTPSYSILFFATKSMISSYILHSFSKLITFYWSSFTWLKLPLFLLKNIFTHKNYVQLNTNSIMFQALAFKRSIYIECSKNPTLEPYLHTFTSRRSFSQLCISNYRLLGLLLFMNIDSIVCLCVGILSRSNFSGCDVCIIVLQLCHWCCWFHAFLFFIHHDIF